MSKKLICSVSVALVLVVAGAANAKDLQWVDAAADHLWTSADNWKDGDGPPTDMMTGAASKLDGTVIEIPDGIDAVCKGFMLGQYGVTNEALVSGGSLTCQWLDVGRVNQKGGSGYLKVAGGSVNCSAVLKIPNQFATLTDFSLIGAGHVDLYGGTLSCGSFLIGNRQVGKDGGKVV